MDDERMDLRDFTPTEAQLAFMRSEGRVVMSGPEYELAMRRRQRRHMAEVVALLEAVATREKQQ